MTMMTTKFLQNFWTNKIVIIFKNIVRILSVFFTGFLFCWLPLLAPLISGWLGRHMRFAAVRTWAASSDKESKLIFFNNPSHAIYKYWPHWTTLGSEAQGEFIPAANDTLIHKAFKWLKKIIYSLRSDYSSGLLIAFNVWLLTLPLSLLFFLGWQSGWEVSFTKSYEEGSYVPLLFIFSISFLCFIMLYLPIAQARQAVHGNWKSFFDFKTIAIIARHVRFRLFVLSILTLVSSVFLMILTKIIPTLFEQIYDLDIHDRPHFNEVVSSHFFFTVLFFYILLIIIKSMNAKVYALGVMKALASGSLALSSLGEFERSILIENKLFESFQKKYKHHPYRWLNRLADYTLLFATFGIWVSFILVIIIGQFMNMNSQDWFYHPLLHLPYISISNL